MTNWRVKSCSSCLNELIEVEGLPSPASGSSCPAVRPGSRRTANWPWERWTSDKAGGEHLLDPRDLHAWRWGCLGPKHRSADNLYSSWLKGTSGKKNMMVLMVTLKMLPCRLRNCELINFGYVNMYQCTHTCTNLYLSAYNIYIYIRMYNIYIYIHTQTYMCI